MPAQGCQKAQKSAFANMQVQHDEAQAKVGNNRVGLKFEAQIVLRDESGDVSYRLALIVFRTGGLNNGHFYVAEPSTAGAWRVLNQHQASPPMSLRALQRLEGKNAHGMVYIRAQAPAQDDWASLNPSGNVRPIMHAARLAHPASQAEEDAQVQQAMAESAALMQRQHPPSPTSSSPPPPPP